MGKSPRKSRFTKREIQEAFELFGLKDQGDRERFVMLAKPLVELQDKPANWSIADNTSSAPSKGEQTNA